MQKGFSPIYLIVAVILVGLVGAFLLGKNSSTQNSSAVACTLEAKICPDGSSVGRTGPKCEFAACPTTASSSAEATSRKTYQNEKYKFSFNHPNLKECCAISGPIGDAELIITLADNSTETTFGTDESFNGLAVYVVNRVISGEEFNSYLSYQKNALIDQAAAFSGEKSRQGVETNIDVAGQRAVSLKGFSWDNIERLYIPFPDNKKVLVIAKAETTPGSFKTIFDQILASLKFTN